MINPYREFKYYYILNLINHFDQVSRTTLANLTSYRTGTVGTLVKELIDNGIVIESGHLSVGHGRSRSMLQINHEYLCSIGIALLRKKIIVNLVQSDGQSLKHIETRISENEPHDRIIELVLQNTSELVALFPDRRIVGICIACPSYNPILHESESLSTNYDHFNDWIKEDMRSRLEAELKIPTTTSGSIGLPASAEYHYGATKSSQFFINVELSNGIGSSVFCNGDVLLGASQRAGQLGHTVVDYSGASNAVCTCGKVGCVEATSSWPAVKANIKLAINNGAYSQLLPIMRAKGDFLAEDVGRCIENGDQICRHYAREAAIRIGIAVANEVNLFNPDKVVFRGFMLELGSYFKECLRESILQNTLSFSQNFEIIFSESYENQVPLGAAAKVFSTFFRFDDFKWVYNLSLDEFSETPSKAVEAANNGTEEFPE